MSEGQKDIIMNVYCFFCRENPALAKEDITCIMQRTAQAIGMEEYNFQNKIDEKEGTRST
jgi:hypothetical protein